MNEGSDFNRPPDDEARDPLLAALRQRLGENFGQEPSPELWAGIRQRLPGPAPRPWRLRGWRLLPLLAVLASLLLVAVLATRQTRPLPAADRLATYHRPPGQPAPGPASSAGQLSATRPALPAAATPARPSSSEGKWREARNTSPDPAPAAPLLAGQPVAGTTPTAGATTSRPISEPNAAFNARPTSGYPRHSRLPKHGLLAANQTERLLTTVSLPRPTGLPGEADPSAASVTRRAVAGATRPRSDIAAEHRVRPATRRRLAAQAGATPTLPAPPAGATTATRQPGPALAATAHQLYPSTAEARSTGGRNVRSRLLAFDNVSVRPQPGSRGQRSGIPAQHFAGRHPLRTSTAPTRAAGVTLSVWAGTTTAAPTAIDTLAGRRPALPRVAAGLPPVLAAAPDTTRPWVLPVRRWSVLAVAGPTLSYRTLGRAAEVPASSPTPISTAFTSSPRLSTLERPAAGLGAQVQARRVLSGRWALSLGLGYQEYATRLALRVASYNPTYPLLPNLDTVRLVHQRDTYRLLTLPVQLSYTLGPPRRQLALGMLVGFEPGLYVGGRTTENSNCSCQRPR